MSFYLAFRNEGKDKNSVKRGGEKTNGKKKKK